jgi:hypothetical protein
VIATGRSVAGSCDITAAVAFPSNVTSKPITAVTTVLVVGLTQLELYLGGANAVILPQPLPPASMQLAHESLVLLKCDGRNYEQVGPHEAFRQRPALNQRLCVGGITFFVA